jgi:hypothetical protein
VPWDSFRCVAFSGQIALTDPALALQGHIQRRNGMLLLRRKMDENWEDEIRRLDVPRRAGRDQGSVSALSSSLLMKVTSGRAVGSQSKDFGGFGTASGSRVSFRASAPDRAPGFAFDAPLRRCSPSDGEESGVQ